MGITRVARGVHRVVDLSHAVPSDTCWCHVQVFSRQVFVPVELPLVHGGADRSEPRRGERVDELASFQVMETIMDRSLPRGAGWCL